MRPITAGRGDRKGVRLERGLLPHEAGQGLVLQAHQLLRQETGACAEVRGERGRIETAGLVGRIDRVAQIAVERMPVEGDPHPVGQHQGAVEVVC